MTTFSRRTAWPRQENALAQALDAARGRPLLDLTASNPTTAGLPYDGAAIRAAIARPAALTYAPEPLGLPAARAAVAAYYARRGITVDPASTLLTASTSEAYTFALRLLCAPGERVAVPAPSYPLFDYLLELADVVATPYRLGWDGAWFLDRDSVRAAIAAGARAIFVVSPNNPTGTVLGDDDRAWLLAQGLPIVSDEVFADYAIAGHRAASLIGLAPQGAASGPLVLSLNGLSKIAGLPQLKLGWMIASGPPADVAEAMARLELVADTFLSVGTPVMAGLDALLAQAEPWQDALRARLAANRAALVAALAGSALRMRPSDGGWSAIVDIPRIEPEVDACLRLLREADVVVHPGHFFDLAGEGAVVVSLLVPEAQLAEGAARLVRVLDQR